jgi:hypothetical protein
MTPEPNPGMSWNMLALGGGLREARSCEYS